MINTVNNIKCFFNRSPSFEMRWVDLFSIYSMEFHVVGLRIIPIFLLNGLSRNFFFLIKS